MASSLYHSKSTFTLECYGGGADCDVLPGHNDSASVLARNKERRRSEPVSNQELRNQARRQHSLAGRPIFGGIPKVCLVSGKKLPDGNNCTQSTYASKFLLASPTFYPSSLYCIKEREF
jgi:hypothetical protein